jgi:hypothetical protein
MSIISAGSINERGFVNSLDRQGFIPVKSGSELIANLSDAFATTGIFICNYPNTITLCDDGCGMTFEKIKHMVDIFRENHSEHKSMGVSGMGGSAASFQLSKNNNKLPTKVIVHTKHNDDKYLKAIIPWDEIFEQGIFTGKVQINEMSLDEINNFQTERKKYGLKNIGTSIIFNYSELFFNFM